MPKNLHKSRNQIPMYLCLFVESEKISNKSPATVPLAGLTSAPDGDSPCGRGSSCPALQGSAKNEQCVRQCLQGPQAVFRVRIRVDSY